jgi:hypothetical protein
MVRSKVSWWEKKLVKVAQETRKAINTITIKARPIRERQAKFRLVSVGILIMTPC